MVQGVMGSTLDPFVSGRGSLFSEVAVLERDLGSCGKQRRLYGMLCRL